MIKRVFGFISLVLLPSLALADFAAPFAVQNQNPFVSLYGLPRYGAAEVVGEGENAFDVSYTVASSFDGDENGTAQVRLDGESERLGVRYLRGLGNGWEAGVDLPFIKHSAGYLDGLIIDWHDFFNLPQGGRDMAPKHQLRYSVDAPDTQVSLVDRAAGVGDVQLMVGKQLRRNEASATSLRVHVKLPTGDSDELLGSGGHDVSLTLHHVARVHPRLDVGVSAGATLLDEGDVLPAQTRSVVGHFGTFASFAASQRLRLILQWDVHSPVFEDIDLPQLEETAYLLSFGADYRVGTGNLRFSVVENFPHPEISPDVAFMLSWQWVPGINP
jgi:hypothetical protein